MPEDAEDVEMEETEEAPANVEMTSGEMPIDVKPNAMAPADPFHPEAAFADVTVG